MINRSIYTFILAALVASLGFVSTFAQTRNMPTLSGAKAIEELRQSGTYDSLKAAVDAARKADGGINNDAIGETRKLTASDGLAQDQFGSDVAINGNTAVVGAYLDDTGANLEQGSAYVFVRSGTVWTQQAKLVAPDGAAFDRFGVSVSISGDTIIVGAYLRNVGANADQGAAYVYSRSGTVWTHQATLTANDGGNIDRFGYSVSVDGSFAVIGAYSQDVAGNAERGAAYVFQRLGTTWIQETKLTGPDGAAGDNFGYEVSISGTTVAIGAPRRAVGGNAAQGAVYVFNRFNAQFWLLQGTLTAADGEANDRFGFSVAISGDTIVAGALAADVGTTNDQGAAYVFERSASVWTQTTKLFADDGFSLGQYGLAVAASGNTIVVGANFHNLGTDGAKGAAYIYNRAGASWNHVLTASPSDGLFGDTFGSTVAVNAGYIIVGSVNGNVGDQPNAGAAYLYRTLSTTWSQESQKVASDGATGDTFGVGVSINGNTAVVGASQNDNGANINQGAAYVFVRNGSSWTQQAKITAPDGQIGDFFGRSVAIHADTLVVGAHRHWPGGVVVDQGAAYVFVRSGSTWSFQSKLLASDGNGNEFFGYSVDISSETIVVGAFAEDIGANTDQGAAYIFVRSGNVWTQQAKLTAADGAAGDQLGADVAIRDNTVLLGANLDDVGTNANQGSAYVFVRSGTTWTEQARLTAADGAANDELGFDVALDGDTAVAGAYRDDIGTAIDRGSAYVFTRDANVWTQTSKLTSTDGAAGDFFGISVAIGNDTIAIGATLDDVGANANQGSVYFYSRDNGIWIQRQRLSDSGGDVNDQFGSSVAVSGDKVIVGAWLSDAAASNPLSNGDGLVPSATDQGSAFIFINLPFVPTAASASISGHVQTSEGAGIRNATVTISGGNLAAPRTVSTGSLGAYRFDDIEVGKTYFVTVGSKRFRFTNETRIVELRDHVTDADFVADGQ